MEILNKELLVRAISTEPHCVARSYIKMTVDQALKVRMPEGYSLSLENSDYEKRRGGLKLNYPEKSVRIESYDTLAHLACAVISGFMDPIVLEAAWADFDGAKVRLQHIPWGGDPIFCSLMSPDKLVMCDNINEWSYDVGIDLATHPEDWHSCNS